MAVKDQPAKRSDYSPERVVFRTDHSGGTIQVRPNEFLANASDGIAVVTAKVGEILAEIDGVPLADYKDPPEIEEIARIRGDWTRYRLAGDDVDVIRLVRGLRDRGIAAQPNHVYFVSSLGNRVASQFDPNLFAPNLFAPNLFVPNLFAPNLFAPNLFAPNLFAGGGAGAGCCCRGGLTDSETRSVPEHAARPRPAAENALRRVEPLDDPIVAIHAIDIASPGDDRDAEFETGELEDPGHLTDQRAVDENADGWVDPAVGHGDFVKSIVELESNLPCTLWHAADPLGDIDDACLVMAMQEVDKHVGNAAKQRKILNLSLSGYNEDDRPSIVLADQVKSMIKGGWLIVASAGNNASCRLAWPAALPDVVAVGAYGPCGPAWFSNFGPWVDASGPGVDVLAEFPDLGAVVTGSPANVATIDDPEPGDKSVLDTTDYSTGWAMWSGTSFSAPFVTARLAAQLQESPSVSRQKAIARALDNVVRDQDLDRLPYYGTIVA